MVQKSGLWQLHKDEELLRPLAGYTLPGHKANGFMHCELKIAGILNKIDEYRLNWHLHLQRMPQNRIPLKSYHYRPQGRRTIWKTEETLARTVVTLETEQIKLVQSLMLMMMIDRGVWWWHNESTGCHKIVQRVWQWLNRHPAICWTYAWMQHEGKNWFGENWGATNWGLSCALETPVTR